MSALSKRLLVGLIPLFIASACNEHGLIPANEVIEAEKQDGFTQLESNAIDILWVIDNSGSMCQEQVALTENFDAFTQGLAEINADFHIAVVTTDMQSDNGRFQTAPGSVGAECSDAEPLSCPPSTGPVLMASDYGFNPDDPNGGLNVDQLQQDFRCIATVGTNGDGFEKGLDAMTTALSSDLLGTVNAGFRREEAWLAIIFVTDENDCSEGGATDFVNGNECEWNRDSLTPAELYTDFLLNYPGTAGGERVLVAGIIGPDNGVRPERPNDPRPSCSNPELGDAFAGYRYESVINAFGERGALANICQDDFDVALDQITSVIRANLATKCLREVPACTSVDDCSGENPTCAPRDPDLLGPPLCSNFELAVERRDEQGEWYELPDPTADQPAYEVNFNATNCPNGIGIEFTTGNEPGAGSEFRIRYPVQLQIGGGARGASDDELPQ